jgi:hypothetical protein
MRRPSMSRSVDDYVARPSRPAPDTMTGILAQYHTEPDETHLQRASQALQEVAEAISLGGTRGKPLPVRLCHFRQNHMLAADLRSFNVQEFDLDGKALDPFESGLGPRFAVVLNKPVWVQVQTVLTLLAQLNSRQRYIKALREKGGDATNVDLDAARLDREAEDEMADYLRFGWRSAAATLAEQANANGLRFQVTYQVDLFQSREEIVPRLPHLRRVYNTFDIVREFIDRAVSMIAGADPRISAGGASASVRGFVQRYTTIASLRHYMHQAVRDSWVCGNGYAAYTRVEPIAMYNLKPEDVVIMPDGRFALERSGRISPIDDYVTHDRGIEQVRSPYGVSVLEVFIGLLQTHEAFESARRFADQVLKQQSAPAQARQWAERMVRQGARVSESQDERLRRLLNPGALARLPEAAPDLYFEGWELLPV